MWKRKVKHVEARTASGLELAVNTAVSRIEEQEGGVIVGVSYLVSPSGVFVAMIDYEVSGV